jgi:hypothetical protein
MIIQPGEHPFVDRPTVVFYGDARAFDIRLVEAGLKQGYGATSLRRGYDSASRTARQAGGRKSEVRGQGLLKRETLTN